MKVRTDKGKARDAREVHVVDEGEFDLPLTPKYCFSKVAEELRSKNHPTTIYSNGGIGSTIQYVPDIAAAKVWLELGIALKDLVES